MFPPRSTFFPLIFRGVDADCLSVLIPAVVSKGFVDLGWKVRGHHHDHWLVEWYSQGFQHDCGFQLRFVLMPEIQIVPCQGGLGLLDNPFLAE